MGSPVADSRRIKRERSQVPSSSTTLARTMKMKHNATTTSIIAPLTTTATMRMAVLLLMTALVLLSAHPASALVGPSMRSVGWKAHQHVPVATSTGVIPYRSQQQTQPERRQPYQQCPLFGRVARDLQPPSISTSARVRSFLKSWKPLRRVVKVAAFTLLGFLMLPQTAVASTIEATGEVLNAADTIATATSAVAPSLPAVVETATAGAVTMQARHAAMAGLSPISSELELRLVLRILYAALMGACLGKERSFAKHSAGVRTMSLVAMGASAYTVCSAYGFLAFDKYDPSRMAANVASGVGFVGAGVITTTGSNKSQVNVVHGLTTAATIWLSAAVGVACGVGLFRIASAAALSTIFILRLGRGKPKRRAPASKSGGRPGYGGQKSGAAPPDDGAEIHYTGDWDEHDDAEQFDGIVSGTVLQSIINREQNQTDSSPNDLDSNSSRKNKHKNDSCMSTAQPSVTSHQPKIKDRLKISTNTARGPTQPSTSKPVDHLPHIPSPDDDNGTAQDDANMAEVVQTAWRNSTIPPNTLITSDNMTSAADQKPKSQLGYELRTESSGEGSLKSAIDETMYSKQRQLQSNTSQMHQRKDRPNGKKP